MEGWIKLHRKILDNPVVCKDSDHIAVWMYLLLNATHKEYPAMFLGNKIMLQPGQLITGRKSIALKFNISESKVQRILKSFESEQQIEQQNGNKNRLVTVLSWIDYQDSEQQNEQQLNNKRTTTEQQLNTNKNVKNVKKDEKEELKPIVDSDECDLSFQNFWNLYPTKGSNKKMTMQKWNTLWKNKKINVDEMMDGVNRYVAYQNHNGYSICATQVFLNQERWKDEWLIEEGGKNGRVYEFKGKSQRVRPGSDKKESEFAFLDKNKEIDWELVIDPTIF